METTKARKQGNSLMIVLNKQLDIKEGQEFYVVKDKSGVIELIPKAEDIYANVEVGAFLDDELDELSKGYTPQGSELDD
ncbi:AbrB family transcriptional regulator [Enterococcus dongliensis]|uniref:AbrB family transcriptional regulator n=1 Tax=Enterococcus dongliensis TaxID=2559925 RepID=A0AAP5NM25_9ENTE|nr:AbrB family transcriptional regulator [Enterococcus dongliensis]MDT2597283.1 AbrB family transcriptional regulator [Enterococcus dongliensis]MDT2604439.1 AbrB family transcriptional regulator [Enterococcus dongliensis]MDT2614605.1 AbrB family transcriptional regulator [Enterococcus dongliensis]MDT2635152.1 AbrB family transcriptional regulator [Enterococcus dongliensis]MDT2637844.1 AbrB family transcriptional regulator [Enterococcus dongliensis]